MNRQQFTYLIVLFELSLIIFLLVSHEVRLRYMFDSIGEIHERLNKQESKTDFIGEELGYKKCPEDSICYGDWRYLNKWDDLLDYLEIEYVDELTVTEERGFVKCEGDASYSSYWEECVIEIDINY